MLPARVRGVVDASGMSCAYDEGHPRAVLRGGPCAVPGASEPDGRGRRNRLAGQWPRAIHSSRCGASAPTVVLSP